MGLLTLLVAIAFTTLYFGRSMEKKPPQLVQVTNMMMQHINEMAKWGAIYGLVGFVLTLLMPYSLGSMLLRLLNDALITLMALPFIYDKLIEKYQAKINVAILDEAKSLVGWISANEKTLSYVGAASAAALFLVFFR